MKATAVIIAIASTFAIGLFECKSELRLTPVWSVSDGLRVPESVLYDAGSGLLYVSNINGKPTEKNNMGFIARVSKDGAMIDPDWVTGLNAPKGMGMSGGTLYVTDIDRIHAIDTASGKILKSHHVEGARFLNDIAIDRKGVVFISDMDANRLYTLEDGAVSIWLELKDYSRPNGLFLEDGTLYAGTAQGVLKIDITKKTVVMDVSHTGGIDGLKGRGDGAFIVSDWKGKTELIARGKRPVVLVDTTAEGVNAADLEYIPGEKLIIIPTFFDNRVVAYRTGI